MADLQFENLDVNIPITLGGELASPYFEDYMFRILSDINALNLTGTVNDSIFTWDLANDELTEVPEVTMAFATDTLTMQVNDGVALATVLTANAAGAVEIYNDDEPVLRVNGGGIAIADIGAGDDPFIEFFNAAFGTSVAVIQASSTGIGFVISNSRNSSIITLAGTNSLSVSVELFTGNPDGAGTVFFDGTAHFATDTDGAIVLTTGAFTLPSGTTAQEPAFVNGMLRYDSTTSKLRGVEGGAWADLITVAPAGVLPVPTVDNALLVSDLAGVDWNELPTVTMVHVTDTMTLSVNDGVALVTAIEADGTGATSLGFNGTLVLATGTQGIEVADETVSDNPAIRLVENLGGTLFAQMAWDTGNFFLDNLVNGGDITIRASVAGQADVNVLFHDSSATDVSLFFDDSIALTTSTRGATIFTNLGASQTGWLEVTDGDGQVGRLVKSGGGQFRMRNVETSGTLLLEATDSTITVVSLLEGDPNGALELFFDAGTLASLATTANGVQVSHSTNSGTALLEISAPTSNNVSINMEVNNTTQMQIQYQPGANEGYIRITDTGDQLRFFNLVDGDMATFIGGAAAELYFAGALAFETDALGVDVFRSTGTTTAVQLLDSASVLEGQIASSSVSGLFVDQYLEGLNTQIRGTSTGGSLGDRVYLLGDPDADVQLSFDGSVSLETIGDARFGIGAVQAASGATALSRTMAGVEMTSATMNTTSQFTPALKFMSTDVSFTTENPKFLAAVLGEATEPYAADTDGGMALSFFVTPNNPGTTNVPAIALKIGQNSALQIFGDIDHDGTNIGFYGTTPAAQSSGYTLNATVVIDRTLLQSTAATATNNNNVLAALITDLQNIGILG